MSTDSHDFAAGLRIFHGTRLEDLVPELARNLAAVPLDPFVEEVIVIPNSGIGDWLQRELPDLMDMYRPGATGSGRRSILANFQLVTTNVFAGLVLGRSATESRWSRHRLLWFVHRAIDELGWDAVPGTNENRLRIADAIADLFDRYATHRPTMLEHWRAGRMTDGVDPSRSLPTAFRWQVSVYQRVCELIEDDTIFGALDELRQGLSDGDIPRRLPKRVHAFGFTSVGPLLQQLIDVMALVAPVEVFLLHPIEGDWSHSIAPAGARWLLPREHEVAPTPMHPLTARWGRMAVETRRLVEASVRLVGKERPDSLLGSLQVALTSPADAPMVSFETEDAGETLRHGDGSLQVHACHGRARQVEVLRDALLHQLEADHSLHLDDILIICPDIEGFAPLIPAIFRSDDPAFESNPRPMRVRIAELDVVDESPIIDAFMAVLVLTRARLGVAEVLGFLSLPVVAARFGLDDDSIARLTELTDDLHIAFGIDAAHRSQWGMAIDLTTGTWRFGLSRLMMGLAVEAPLPLVGPGGVVPFDDVSVTDVPLFGALADFFQRLEALIDDLSRSRTPAEWLRIFEGVVDAFTASKDPEAGRAELMLALDEIEFAAFDAEVSSNLSFEEIMPVLRSHLSQRSRRPIFRSGDITVSRTPPVQGVPYRVIAVLGADEPMFAAGGTTGDDVLTIQPCVGEPDPSTQGRQALLNVILAARDTVIITCEGADIGTNKPVPLAVPLQELLESCVPIVEGRHFGTHRVLARHPRQNFHPSVMKGGLVFGDAPFTFDPGSLEVHVGMSPPGTDSSEPKSATSGEVPGTWTGRVLDVSDLTSAVENPIEWFVGSVANVRIDSLDKAADDDVLPIEIDNLLTSTLARELVQFLRGSEEFRSGGDLGPVIQHWGDTTVRAGIVPPGELGRTELGAIVDEVLMFMSAIPREYFDTSIYRAMSVEQDVPASMLGDPQSGRPWRVAGEVTDIVDRDLVRLIFKRPTEALYLGVAVELALLARLDPVNRFRAIVVTRGITKERPVEPVVMTLSGDDPGTRRKSADDFLLAIAELAEQSFTGLVPLFPRASARLARGDLKKAASGFEKDCEYSAVIKYFFGHTSWEELVRDTRTNEVARVLWSAFDSALRVEPFVQGVPS